ncbi:MAG: hypothetical protein OSA92_09795 [Pirellulaceae bacterium]|nr:hypothetical protein [Pirellulaceae bacterium]
MVSVTSHLQVADSWNIPANAANVILTLDAIDDLILDGTQTVTLSADAVGYASDGSANFSATPSHLRKR